MNYTQYKAYFIFFFAGLIGAYSCQDRVNTDRPGHLQNLEEIELFQLKKPDETGIFFSNQLNEGLNTNILMYEYFYNGAGVASGDFNGDNLADIYFVSNMGDNEFYLNTGDLTFKKITAESGAIGRSGPWKTGVSAIDINGDDKLDLYLCYSGTLPAAKRKNQLYINKGNDENGVPIFVEMAEQYGIASSAYSTQSYFFDYDRDGDLDMLLLNHNPKNLPILNEFQTAKLLKVDDPIHGIRLYEQMDGRFRDATIEAGISSSSLTYGLGLGIGDFNNDNWPDFYVSNDYSVPDYFYINNQDGSFINELPKSMGHTSNSSMGNDVGDINNDGLLDILTLDMLPEDNYRQKLLLSPDAYAKFDLIVRSGFHFQYMRNMLQLNNGDGTFSEIGQYAGISNTDWSWSALIADYDNDGFKDVHITNGYFRDYTNLDFIRYMDDYVQKKGRLVREDVVDIIKMMPSSDIANYMFRGTEENIFENVTTAWSMNQKANSNGAAYADLDNDGDLEIIVNNIGLPAFIYENKANEKLKNSYLQIQLRGADKNTKGIGARVSVFANGNTYLLEQFPSRGYQSSVSEILHIGLGEASTIDSLHIIWQLGKTERLSDVSMNTLISLNENQADAQNVKNRTINETVFTKIESPVSYSHSKRNVRDFDRQPLLISEISNNGPCMAKGDINGDGLDDVYVGGAVGEPGVIYVQNASGGFIISNQDDFLQDLKSEDCDAIFFDANNDGNVDLYVASGGYHIFGPSDPVLADRLYINDGSGKFLKDSDAIPDSPKSNSCVSVADINHDGFPDLFVGGGVIPGRFPEIPRSMILINDGSGKFEIQTSKLAPDLERIGLVTDAEWADLNSDGAEDLIVVGEWMPVSIFMNRDGKLINETSRMFNRAYHGFWNTIKLVELNEDGIPDFIVGNTGTNIQFKVTEEQPAEMYFADFDGNHSIDPIFCYYIQGNSYPYITRDELKRQLASMSSKFPSYKSYANTTLQDLFSKTELKDADYLKVDRMETSLFISSSAGGYELQPLPCEVQYAPIYSINVLDYNKDGMKDLLLCGNNSKFKLRLGKSDANYGVLLKGKGKGRFEYIKQSESGLRIIGDVKSVIKINDVYLFGMNESQMLAYKMK